MEYILGVTGEELEPSNLVYVKDGKIFMVRCDKCDLPIKRCNCDK